MVGRTLTANLETFNSIQFILFAKLTLNTYVHYLYVYNYIPASSVCV